MFDRAELMVKAGHGGNGVASFRREKFVPLGGPDGGDGGDGGNVVIRADSSVASLIAFQKKSVYRAAHGGNGRGKKKHGKKGDDLMLAVPVGTVISSKTQFGNDADNYDLIKTGQQVIVARGGRGGLGNVHFTSSTNQAPQIAQKGEAGEERGLLLELKLIADVGVVGYPNAGKSSLLVAASAAKPKIAGYPFTTLEPVLGVVEIDYHSFVLAEIPGLIAGAHIGRGLGHDFLRHVMRTKILIHLVDGGSPSPVEDMIQVNNEISLFDSALARKPQVLAINKIDLPEVRTRMSELKEALGVIGISPLFISAITGEGVSILMTEVLEMLDRVAEQEELSRRVQARVFYPKPRSDIVSVQREGDIFVVQVPGLERIIAGTDITDPEARRQLTKHVNRAVVRKALEKAGAKPGDKVHCGNLEWYL